MAQNFSGYPAADGGNAGQPQGGPALLPFFVSDFALRVDGSNPCSHWQGFVISFDGTLWIVLFFLLVSAGCRNTT